MSATSLLKTLAVVLTVLFAWGVAQADDPNDGAGVHMVVGKIGGVLSAQNGQGDAIELTIPAGALTEDVEITMRPLSTPLVDPIARHVFPGVELLPNGLTLLVPATLELVPAQAVADPTRVVLYHVQSEDFIVPLSSLPRPALIEGEEPVQEEPERIAGCLDHFSTYGAGEPTLDEAQALVDLAFAMMPDYDPYGYEAFRSSVSEMLALLEMMALLGADDEYDRYSEMLGEAVLARIKAFLDGPRPEPPCDSDYIHAVIGYFEVMALLGLPVYDNVELNREVDAVRSQMQDLFKEVTDRCLRQLNLYINIDVIWGEYLEKNYNGTINLGWQIYGDDPNYVYGTAKLPTTGGGAYGGTTTTFDGVWYVVAQGSVTPATNEAGVMTDLVLDLTLSGEVVEEVASCNPMGCASATSMYHQEKTVTLSIVNLTSTTVTIEDFEGGVAITTTTLERVTDPLSQ
ncbi:MAG: hypothetical protein KBE65_03430 [Phycisphaerae bacterium]|nr:hypothetical protein [Phycisphaerae bacterium]